MPQCLVTVNLVEGVGDAEQSDWVEIAAPGPGRQQHGVV